MPLNTQGLQYEIVFQNSFDWCLSERSAAKPANAGTIFESSVHTKNDVLLAVTIDIYDKLPEP